MKHMLWYTTSLLVFVAADSLHVFPRAQPPASQGPDYNAYYQIGPDSLPKAGVPKARCADRSYSRATRIPARSIRIGCMCRPSTTVWWGRGRERALWSLHNGSNISYRLTSPARCMPVVTAT
jgi:hypothetical protein